MKQRGLESDGLQGSHHPRAAHKLGWGSSSLPAVTWWAPHPPGHTPRCHRGRPAHTQPRPVTVCVGLPWEGGAGGGPPRVSCLSHLHLFKARLVVCTLWNANCRPGLLRHLHWLASRSRGRQRQGRWEPRGSQYSSAWPCSTRYPAAQRLPPHPMAECVGEQRLQRENTGCV